MKKIGEKKPGGKGLIWGFRMCRKQWPLMLLITVVCAVYAVLNIVFAMLTMELINAAAGKEKAVFVRHCVLLSCVLLTQLILSGARHYLVAKCHAKNITAIRQRQFDAILYKRYNQVSRWHSGELLNRIVSDSAYISDTITAILPDLVSCVVQLALAVLMLARMDSLFTVILLCGGVLLYGIGRVISAKVKKYHKSSQAADGKSRSYMQETLGSLLVIKVFDAFESVKQKSKKLHDDFYRVQISRAKFSTLSSVCFSTVSILAYAFSLFWCGARLMSGTLTFGGLTAVQQLVARVQAPLTTLSSMFPRLANLEASAERLMEVEMLQDESHVEMPAAFLAPNDRFEKIEISDFTFAYDYSQIDENPVISHMNLTIARGDFIALTGHSGIGKSTIFKLLLGVYDKYRGSLLLTMSSGTYPLGADTRALFAYVPQGNFLFSGTIRENVTFTNPGATDAQIWDALEVACAAPFVRELEEQLDTVIGERGAGLSEGQVQRLAIARAVLSGAQVLLLDEATSALDEETEATVLQHLQNMHDKTCLIVTHRPAALAICNKKVEMGRKE